MAAKTGIQWTNATWNPWYGCRRISAGCANCYAERWAKRTGRDFSQVTRAADTTFYAPLGWKESRLIFVCSLSDFFLDGFDLSEWDFEFMEDCRQEAWELIRQSPQHTYLILTKRPENISRMLPPDWGAGWPNVWLGVTVESVDYVGRAETLAGIPVYGNQRFISYEPAIECAGPNKLLRELFSDGKFGWFIAGGESGPGARPANPLWFPIMREECAMFSVPFFLKQLGGTKKIDGAFGGYTLPDGSQPREFPPELGRFFAEK